MNNASKYLEGLNERQREAVLHTDGPLLIVAGAGAGKTKTITHRIARMIEDGVPAYSIVAVTFTNKAAGEMRERVKNLLTASQRYVGSSASPSQAALVIDAAHDADRAPSQAMRQNPHTAVMPLVTTFHSLGVRILREFYEQAGLERGFTIWDRDDSQRAVKRALEKLSIEDVTPRAALSIISRHKNDCRTVSEASEIAKSFREKAAVSAWPLYEDALREESALDFDDLLLRTLNVLRTRADVLEKLRGRYRYITVDEYQDTNTTQFQIIRLLTGDTQNICVVGDSDQTLYSWRGANMELMLTFQETFPNAKIVLLEQNYRSTRTIISAANAVIAKNVKRHPKNLFTDNDIGEAITRYTARNEIDEAWFVAQMAAHLVEQGADPSKIAVLYRENALSRTVEDAMLAFGLPYRVLGVKYFDRKEVKDALSYLRAAINPKNKSDLSRIVSIPPRGIGKVTLEKMLEGGAGEQFSSEHARGAVGKSFSGAAATKVRAFYDQLAQIRHAVETLCASDAVRACIEVSGLEKYYTGGDSEENAERLANVRELVNVAVRFDEISPPDGISQLLEQAALQSEQDDDPRAGGGASHKNGGVSLMTVHASKGLEFDIVFVIGLEQGLFPSIRDDTRDNEEERRLFYVAITRARKQLFLSAAQERMKYGTRERALPSEFMADIDERLITNLSRDGGSYGSKAFETIIT